MQSYNANSAAQSPAAHHANMFAGTTRAATSRAKGRKKREEEEQSATLHAPNKPVRPLPTLGGGAADEAQMTIAERLASVEEGLAGITGRSNALQQKSADDMVASTAKDAMAMLPAQTPITRGLLAGMALGADVAAKWTAYENQQKMAAKAEAQRKADGGTGDGGAGAGGESVYAIEENNRRVKEYQKRKAEEGRSKQRQGG